MIEQDLKKFSHQEMVDYLKMFNFSHGGQHDLLLRMQEFGLPMKESTQPQVVNHVHGDIHAVGEVNGNYNHLQGANKGPTTFN